MFVFPNVDDVHIAPVQTRGTHTRFPSQSCQRDTSHTDSVVISVVTQTVIPEKTEIHAFFYKNH